MPPIRYVCFLMNRLSHRTQVIIKFIDIHSDVMCTTNLFGIYLCLLDSLWFAWRAAQQVDAIRRLVLFIYYEIIYSDILIGFFFFWYFICCESALDRQRTNECRMCVNSEANAIQMENVYSLFAPSDISGNHHCQRRMSASQYWALCAVNV